MHNPFKHPQYPELITESLEQAKKDCLTHSSLREYHAAMERMLIQRIDRLSREMKEAGYL